MPFYGKRRRMRAQDVSPLGITRVRLPAKDISREKNLQSALFLHRVGRKTFFPYEKWPNETTRLSDVERRLGIDTESWIARRHALTRRKVRVLDWGCGKGTAITQLAMNNRSMVDAFGYSFERYPAWKKNKFVDFIWEDSHRLLRVFRPNSIDLILSNLGIRWMYSELAGNPKRAILLSAYVKKLAAKLRRNGGLLVAQIPPDVENFFEQNLSSLMGRAYVVKIERTKELSVLVLERIK